MKPPHRRTVLRLLLLVAIAGLIAAALFAGYWVMPRLERIEVTPSAALIRPGERVTLRAEGVYSDGRRAPLKPVWRTNGGVQHDETTDGTTIVGLSIGLASVVARADGVEGHALIGVSKFPPVRGPLRRDSRLRRYFADSHGSPVWLTGSHVWSNFQDHGESEPLQRFDYDAYLKFMVAHGHNFVRLWRSEQANWLPVRRGDYRIEPQPWLRPGPGLALDNRPRFDLESLNPEYFRRLRERVEQAQELGIFVSVMLFNGWSVEPKGTELENPWRGHPFNRANNINGVDGDPDNDERGRETHQLMDPTILKYQQAFVRRVVETLNDLNNVLYEVSNESTGGSIQWQYQWVDYIRAVEADLPNRHPVGITAERPGESNDALFASSADWVSPFRYNNRPLDPFPWHGDKVVLNDTDHLCGVCGSVPWVWRALARGHNAVMMDPYDEESSELAEAAHRLREENWATVRRNMGYARVLSDWIDLSGAEPFGGLTSPGYALANLGSAEQRWIIYADEQRRLSLIHGHRNATAHVRWLDPLTGRLSDEERIVLHAPMQLEVPWRGDAVLMVRILRGDTGTAQ